MKRLIDLGVSNPLTLGMGHPLAGRLETLGRARPTTWPRRLLALSAIGIIGLSSAPMTLADVINAEALPHVLTVIPDMSDAQITDLRAIMDKMSAGQADKEILTEFMRQNRDKLVAKYYPDDVLANVTFGVPISHAKEIVDEMPSLLERCKSERTENFYVMRASFSWGGASVSCSTGKFSLPPRSE